MDINALSAAQKYTAQRPATAPNPSVTPGDAAQRMVHDFATTLQEAETTATGAMTGEADPHALVQALAQAELAVETAVTVRNKVVEAYQEILRMPV
ncbi:flagellar hook-basal body complex protein FliE [Roseovarius sp. E0-M6]|uniref:flagellar hook-basal body complex protein FliE n=1 Tax=Roseovarius sp. E0-M6 TaxID=3127118 RepID=UPI0030101899